MAASGVTPAELDGQPAFGVEGADVVDALVNSWLKILMCVSFNGSVEMWRRVWPSAVVPGVLGLLIRC